VVSESAAEDDGKIVRELFNWSREDAICVPWVKDVKDIVVKEN
jgi:hypothetical protein